MSTYDNLDIAKVHNIKLHVENNAQIIENIVDEIIQPYSKDLDRYVAFIADCLKDGENPPTTSELEDFCLNLSAQIYFAGGMCENLGIKDDISKAVWKETYNTARDDYKGTIADKNAQAELQSQQEQLTNICFSRAYKKMKSKIDAAQELLSSCKKALTHRMSEMELTHMMNHID